MKVSVYGLGYVGLPTAIAISLAGHEVLGVDIEKEKIRNLKNKIGTVADDFVAANLPKVAIEFDTSPQISDIHIICVPTPVDHRYHVDLSAVKAACETIVSVLRDGDLVVVESTIYPGVCEDIVLPVLRKDGKRCKLAHCPERINPGDEKWNVLNIPRILGGIDKESTVEAERFYSSFLKSAVRTVGTIKAAEATKILENTFRDTNIAFVNEMAMSFARLDIDITDVIRAASTKPFGFMPFYPGAGVGGHCIAVDPYYMIERGKEAGFDHEFLRLARKINEGMPSYVVGVLAEALNEAGLPLKGTNVVLLGLAYKPNIADARESPSYGILASLKKAGCNITVFDPFVSKGSTVSSLDEALLKADAVVLATAHAVFLREQEKFSRLRVVVDGRNCLNREMLTSGGVIYRGVGR